VKPKPLAFQLAFHLLHLSVLGSTRFTCFFPSPSSSLAHPSLERAPGNTHFTRFIPAPSHSQPIPLFSDNAPFTRFIPAPSSPLGPRQHLFHPVHSFTFFIPSRSLSLPTTHPSLASFLHLQRFEEFFTSLTPAAPVSPASFLHLLHLPDPGITQCHSAQSPANPPGGPPTLHYFIQPIGSKPG
jgi:hypothetical protein